MWKYGVDEFESEQGPVFCENSIESSGFHNVEVFLDEMTNCYLLWKKSTSSSGI
jgi:hypothetical protein